MANLFRKYASNQISAKELSELSNNINSMTDSSLESHLTKLWMEESGNQADEEKLKVIKRNIDRENSNKQRFRTSLTKKTLRIAASIAIPFFLAFMYFLTEKESLTSASDMIVKVASGDQVNLILPDSTRVKLNSETTLNYNINEFNKKTREISLNGEAYFEVERNEKKPFIIKTKEFDVKVLGTKFNLQARDEEQTTELHLIKGKVSITANERDQQVVLYANQKAVFDKFTGEIKVYKDNALSSTAWLRGELMFYATPIRKVFRKIERNYGVNIQIDEDEIPYNDLFTGTFSIDNLNETLEILRMHYHFNYTIEGKEVVIEDFRFNNRTNN